MLEISSNFTFSGVLDSLKLLFGYLRYKKKSIRRTVLLVFMISKKYKTNTLTLSPNLTKC